MFNDLTNSYIRDYNNFIKSGFSCGFRKWDIVTSSSFQRLLAEKVIVEPEMCWSRFYEAFGFQYDTTSQLMVKLSPWVCNDKDV